MRLSTPIATLGDALNEAAAQLAAAGIDEPRREARLILAAALGCEVVQVWNAPEAALAPRAWEEAARLVARRASREPLSRLLGYREFWSLRFALSPATLDPRADSETVIEAALAILSDRNRPYRVLDFGTGTGCLLLALLSELPQGIGLGIDLCEAAARMARQNAAALGLADRAWFAASDWGEALAGQWDVILANPPYIPNDDIPALMPEVALFEPQLALEGGADGLGAYRLIGPHLNRLLAPDGYALLEIGAGQRPEVEALMVKSGLVLSGVRHDLSGTERCLILGRQRDRSNFARLTNLLES